MYYYYTYYTYLCFSKIRYHIIIILMSNIIMPSIFCKKNLLIMHTRDFTYSFKYDYYLLKFKKKKILTKNKKITNNKLLIKTMCDTDILNGNKYIS